MTNAFDPIRILLALMVVYSHSYILGGFGLDQIMDLTDNQTDAGKIAVLGFFGISGFLVTGSMEKRKSALGFIAARGLRILPAFYFALALTAFVLAPAITTLNAQSSPYKFAHAWEYFSNNWLVASGQWSIQGVLDGLPYTFSINPSQWSLFWEIVCYIFTFIAGVAVSRNGGRTNLILLTASMLLIHAGLFIKPDMKNLAPILLSRGGAPYVLAYMMGTIIYTFRDHLNLGGGQAILWGAICAALLKFGGWGLLGPLVLPFAIIHAAHAFRCKLPIDLSYGIYLLHCPILHLLAAGGINKLGLPIYIGAAILLTGSLAWISWVLIEKPALTLKPRIQEALLSRTDRLNRRQEIDKTPTEA